MAELVSRVRGIGYIVQFNLGCIEIRVFFGFYVHACGAEYFDVI
jgi:hypothetical protein